MRKTCHEIPGQRREVRNERKVRESHRCMESMVPGEPCGSVRAGSVAPKTVLIGKTEGCLDKFGGNPLSAQRQRDIGPDYIQMSVVYLIFDMSHMTVNSLFKTADILAMDDSFFHIIQSFHPKDISGYKYMGSIKSAILFLQRLVGV